MWGFHQELEFNRRTRNFTCRNGASWDAIHISHISMGHCGEQAVKCGPRKPAKQGLQHLEVVDMGALKMGYPYPAVIIYIYIHTKQNIEN